MLLAFLRKFHLEKAGALQRIIITQKDKVIWCEPQTSSDRYNLEVKLNTLADVGNAIKDCEQRKADLNNSLELLRNVETPETIQTLTNERDTLLNDLATLQSAYKQTKENLIENIALWQKYEQSSDNISAWLKDIENKIRNESVNHIDWSSIDTKIEEIKKLQIEIQEHDKDIEKLAEIAKQIPEHNVPDSRIEQYVQHLNNRYQSAVKFVAAYLERFENLNKNKNLYKQAVKNVEDWLVSAEQKVDGFAKFTKHGHKPDHKALDQLKQFAEDRDRGQRLLNEAVEAGEALFSGVIPENREEIRSELRALRDASESLVDRVNSIYKEIETIILKRSSIQENNIQLQRWIVDLQQKLESKLPLDTTLPEKKATLHNLKTQLQDVQVHQLMLTQLEEKIQTLSDADELDILQKSLQECNTLANTLESHSNEAEKRVNNHESYQKNLEKNRDWLNALIVEASVVTEDIGQVEKEGADAKIALIQNLLQQKDEGEKNLAGLKSQLDIVITETNKKGHKGLKKVFDGLMNDWANFLSNCKITEAKLNEITSKWNKFEKVIDELEQFVKQKELQVKDQSLRNTLEAKRDHLEKLNALQKEILDKNDAFNVASTEAQLLEGDADLQTKVSHLLTRYQTLKNNTKEAIIRYEQFVKEHQSFNENYHTFIEWLSTQGQSLEELTQIVGDLSILQDRQKQIKELLEVRNKKVNQFESLIDQGEKLYVHTSPDGREIIRQQLKNLRTIWDGFSDDIQTASNKLDYCLTQFAEFTQSQDQLTKWLKDVEKAMQQHTELKASLQEKRAQLQNHKLMHQEIMSHQNLVESVCDKAQQLVDQTQDKSLNVYLQSIKTLFQNIVQKSKDLLDNLDDCVVSHEKFNTQYKQFKDWMKTESEKLVECDDISGEKADINKRLMQIQALKDNYNDGCKLLNQIEETFKVVAKSTSNVGVEMLQREVDELQLNLKEHLQDIGKSS